MRVVVADEESESLDIPGRVALTKPQLTSAQDKQIGFLLNKYTDVIMICSEVGMVLTTKHWIDTGNQTPIRSVPYRLAPAWRDQLRREICTC